MLMRELLTALRPPQKSAWRHQDSASQGRKVSHEILRDPSILLPRRAIIYYLVLRTQVDVSCLLLARGMILRIPFEMKCFAQLAALSLALLPSSVVGLTVPRYFQNTPFTRRDLSVTQVQQELGASISNGSTIFGPDDPRFANATERYSTHAIPDIEVVVVPATEADVSTIV